MNQAQTVTYQYLLLFKVVVRSNSRPKGIFDTEARGRAARLDQCSIKLAWADT